jgi:hypothetical protein
MKKISSALSALSLALALVVPSLADTIHLKDGAVIRGQVIDFKDQQFTILIGAGTKGRRSRTMVYVEDVESIEFDSGTTGSAAATANEDMGAQPNAEPAAKPQRTNSQAEKTNASPRTTGSLPTDAPPTFFTIKVAVRADNANNGWTNSGLVVRKGQRLRINASGRVSLGNGRFSTPVGIATLPDNEKLLRTEATGALIAVIGDDNDDFILIGSRHDFVAQRDGVLFLGVNEGNLKDNTGTYDVVIEAEAGSPTR